MHEMRPIVTSVARSVVCLSVFWSDCDVLCKNGRVDRDTVSGLTHVGSRNHVVDGIAIPYWKEQFLRVLRPTEKHWESLLRCM